MKKTLFFSALMLGALVLAGCQQKGTPETDSTKLWPAQEDESSEWGFIDQNGKMKVAAKYTQARPFSCNLALVFDGNDAKYLNNSGKVVSAGMPSSDSYNDFYFDVAIINDGGERAFMDKNFKKLFSPKFAELRNMSADGLAVFREKDEKLYGYCDKKGEIKIKASFDQAGAFAGGIAVVVSRNEETGEYRYGIIDTKGNFTYDYQKQPLNNLGEGLVAFQKDNDKWGIMDKKGKVVLDATYGRIMPFTNGLAQVKKFDGFKWGFVDTKGNEKIDVTYASVEPFYEDVAWVKKEGEDKRWELIDKSGNTKFELSKSQSPSSEYSYYRQGLCPIIGESKYEYINKKGETVYSWKPKFGGYYAPARKAAENPMRGTEFGPLFESYFELDNLK